MKRVHNFPAWKIPLLLFLFITVTSSSIITRFNARVSTNCPHRPILTFFFCPYFFIFLFFFYNVIVKHIIHTHTHTHVEKMLKFALHWSSKRHVRAHCNLCSSSYCEAPIEYFHRCIEFSIFLTVPSNADTFDCTSYNFYFSPNWISLFETALTRKNLNIDQLKYRFLKWSWWKPIARK